MIVNSFLYFLNTSIKRIKIFFIKYLMKISLHIFQFIIIFIYLFSPNIVCSNSISNGLNFEIQSLKYIYQKNEPIVLEIKFIALKEIICPRRLNIDMTRIRYLYLIIESQDGRKILYSGDASLKLPLLSEEDYILLFKKEIYGKRICLSEGADKFSGWIKGKYKIKAIYRNNDLKTNQQLLKKIKNQYQYYDYFDDKMKNHEIWEGTIESNEIEISIQ